MNFDGDSKSYAKIRTPDLMNRPYLQQDLRLVVSGIDPQVNSNALLCFIGDYDSSKGKTGDYMGLQLDDGNVEFFWSADLGQRMSLSVKVALEPSQTYAIRVVKSGVVTQLMIYEVSVQSSAAQSDGVLIASNSFTDDGQYPKLVMDFHAESTEYYFGGVPSTLSHFSILLGDVSHFTGCIHIFTMNNVVVNIWNYQEASQVSACYPNKTQSPYYRWDDYGFACSWEPDAYVRRRIALSEVFTGASRSTTQQSIRLTDMTFSDISKNDSLLAYGVLRDKNVNSRLANELVEVTLLDDFQCDVDVGDSTLSSSNSLFDRRKSLNSSLSEIDLEFISQSGKLSFSSELKLASGYKVRGSRDVIANTNFSLSKIQSFDLDLFVAGLNSEMRALKAHVVENSSSMIGCFRLRNMFASPNSHTEWLEYEKWAHAGLYLYPLAKPAMSSIELSGQINSMFVVVNPPEVGNRVMFQIKTKSSDALVLFMLSPDEVSFKIVKVFMKIMSSLKVALSFPEIQLLSFDFTRKHRSA